MARSLARKPALLVVSFLFALASLACFAIPLYIIRPFRHQGAGELSVALFIKQIGPWLSIACAVPCAISACALWRRAGWIARSGAVFAMLLAVLGVFLSRFNIYEQMFHPLDTPQFEAARAAKLDPDDMVITVEVNGVRRAYPIREMAYHHVVNDVVGGQPILATY